VGLRPHLTLHNEEIKNMKRNIGLVLAAILVSGFLLLNLAPATATHSLPHLIRQVNRLESKVSNLQRDVRTLRGDTNALLFDVFVCQFPGDPLTTFSDGSQGYHMYYDPSCVADAASKIAGKYQRSVRQG
jgi:outer membrane murein-binding lipoprotein Lpp